MNATLSMTVNGRAVSAPAEPRTHLADFLREDALLTGTHVGCEQGVCGACTLYVDGRPVRSCITLAVSCEGADVTTVEGFGEDPLMARLRAAFSAHHALQCGFCTPGMLATAYDIVRRLPDADATRIRRELSGNLCRCTGYQGIVAAIEAVLAEGPPDARVVPLPLRAPPAQAASGAAPVSARVSTAAPATGTLTPFDSYPAAGDLAGAATLTRTVPIAAPAQDVWRLIEDPAAIAAAIPGAHLDAAEGGAFRGHLKVALGPITAQFAGTGAMRLDAAARQGAVRGNGADRLSHTRLGAALDFALAQTGPDTADLTLTATYALAGPLAQFGRPALVAAAADRILADAAARIAARARGETPDDAAAAPERLGGFALLLGIVRQSLGRLLRRPSR
ncbi:MAG: 2Fe-2S iron-sulfur cluster-binding protein [Acuticoccus sp.]